MGIALMRLSGKEKMRSEKCKEEERTRRKGPRSPLQKAGGMEKNQPASRAALALAGRPSKAWRTTRGA